LPFSSRLFKLMPKPTSQYQQGFKETIRREETRLGRHKASSTSYHLMYSVPGYVGHILKSSTTGKFLSPKTTDYLRVIVSNRFDLISRNERMILEKSSPRGFWTPPAITGELQTPLLYRESERREYPFPLPTGTSPTIIDIPTRLLPT